MPEDERSLARRAFISTENVMACPFFPVGGYTLERMKPPRGFDVWRGNMVFYG
jgi:hypothetical protein